MDLQVDFGGTFERVRNYCRLPARSEKYIPWCYTHDTGYDSEPCDIPLCPPNTGNTIAPIPHSVVGIILRSLRGE